MYPSSDDPLIQVFCDEAGDLLVDFEAGLLRLETTPRDPELLNRIFRSAHTLKGNSAMLGFTDVARFTHALEDLLDQLRKGRRAVTPRVVDTLLASADVLRSLLAAIRGGADVEGVAETDTVLEALRALERCREPVSTDEGGAEDGDDGRGLYEIELRPTGDVIRRGHDPLAMLREVAALGEVVQVTPLADALPPLAEMDPRRCYLGWRIWLTVTLPRIDLEACLEYIADGGSLRIATSPGDAGDDRPAPSGRDVHQAMSAGVVPELASIRIPVERVDGLISLVDELVSTQSMVAQAVSGFTPDKLTTLEQAVVRMNRHAHELHERIMAVRMVPIQTLFGRFPRLVRDLAEASGKRAMLEAAGEGIDLEKHVIERIGDALAHLVRNAVDHGLEPPDERLRMGKPARGVVRLEAYEEDGSVYIEVADDGRGLDRDRIVTKAVEHGLVERGRPLADEEAFALIFSAGLSTAERVTAVSGRGVGMDVVRHDVEALGGTVTIESERGCGTTFRIRLPVTPAVVWNDPAPPQLSSAARR